MKLSHLIASPLLLFCAAAALAQGSSPLVSVAPIGTVVVTRGGKAPLDIALRVNRGFHVNSNKPNDELLLPTVVHLDPPEGIMIMNIALPCRPKNWPCPSRETISSAFTPEILP